MSVYSVGSSTGFPTLGPAATDPPVDPAKSSPSATPPARAVDARYQSSFDATPQPSFAARLGSWVGDTAKGYATGAANLVLDAANLSNMGANAALAASGASYRFRTDMHINPTSQTEASAQNAIGVAAMLSPVGAGRSLAVKGTEEAAAVLTKGSAVARDTSWTLGVGKTAAKWGRQMEQRGWTPNQITDALRDGERFPAPNKLNPANAATRYVNPQTGRSVVVDDVTREVLHVGGDGFGY